MTDMAGEAKPSRPISRAMDDLLLMMLGVYALLPYMLVRPLLCPPYPPIAPLPLVRPTPCWFGRCALGMNMKDRSIGGKMYRGGE